MRFAIARATRRDLAVVSALLSIIVGCDGRDDLDGRRRAIPGLTAPDPGKAPAGGGDSAKEISFDLIDNRATALVYSSGALTASGRGIAFALLSLGGKGAMWRLGSGSRPSARVDGQVAHIYFPYDRDPGGIASASGEVPIAFRFRPAARQQLASVFLNDTKLGDLPMDETGVAEYSVNAPAALFRVGENDLRLFFRYAIADEGLRTAGSLERVSIGSARAPATAPVRVAPVERQGARADAFSSAGPARLSFHLRVPESRPTFRFRVAGSGSASVRVAHAGAASRELWRGDAGEDWREESVDLSELAGETVRLDLVGDGALDWARPQIASERRGSLGAASSAATPHVIVWIVSALRADVVEQKTAMPALSKLAEGGVSVSAIARHPSPQAAATEILIGRRPIQATIAASDETLAERFREAGYKTTLYSNAPAINGEGQGFERTIRSPSLSAADLWKRAQSDLKKNAAVRSLTVLRVDEASLPLVPDADRLAPQWRNYVGRVQKTATRALSTQLRAGAPPLSARDKDYVRALYHGELAVVDGAIATMVADLDALGLAEQVGIVVVGDRGAELFERSSFGDPAGLSPGERNVALVVFAPGRSTTRAEAKARLVVSADAFATALDLGQIAPALTSDGESVLAPPVAERATLIRLPTRAAGLATASSVWVQPARGESEFYVREARGQETLVGASDATIARRALINWFSLLVAVPSWDRRRWGQVTRLRPAFSSEHGGF